ncbi:MAG: hypothetical protein ACE5ID_08560, partial [Acidobacteriota bacterium]
MSETDIEPHPTPAPQGGQQSFPWRRWPVLTAFLLALLVMAYAGAVNHPFVYDDIPLVVKNPAIRSLSNLPTIIGFHSDGFHLKNRWTRDVTHALEFAAGGLNPALYHFTNILLHGVVGLLIFIFFARLTRDRMAGWWAAAIFLVHPINTEVVSQVAGRRGLLAALFTMIFFLTMQRYLERQGAWRLAMGLLALYLAAFSKQIGVMAAPAFLLVAFYDRLQKRREGSASPAGNLLSEAWRTFTERKILFTGIMLFALGLTLSLLAFAGDSPGLGGSPSFYETAGPGLGLLDRARLGGMSFRLALFPVGQTVDYSYRALDMTAAGFTLPILLDLAFFLAGLILTLAGLWRRSWLGFAGVWFVIFYLPVSGIISWHEVFA